MPANDTRVPLCIFVKVPEPGRVKTRLVPPLTHHQAADLASAFFADTLSLARSFRWARTIVVCDGDARELELIDVKIVWQQGGGDLGERMERTMRRALSESPMAMIIGTDSPDLPRAALENARNLLDSNDAVLGPTRDGGFYLIGLRRCDEGILSDLPWSESETRERTIERLEMRGYRVALTEPWFDVDVSADVARLEELLIREPDRAPRTAALLNALRSDR